MFNISQETTGLDKVSAQLLKEYFSEFAIIDNVHIIHDENGVEIPSFLF